MNRLATGHLPPIGLDDLVARAELLTRHDRKYVLDFDAASALLTRLDPHTQVLTIDGRRSFAYESVYFDTPDLACYRQSAHRRRHRVKVRTRSYLDSDLAFLEVKTRGRRDVTVKERIPHDIGRCDRLDAAARAYVQAVLGGPTTVDAASGSPASAGLDGHPTWNAGLGSPAAAGLDGREPAALLGPSAAAVVDELRPTLVSRYQRLTLLPPEPGVRVTIDSDLSWSLPARTRTGHSPAELVIVETKAGPRPSEVDRMLWRAGIRPVSFSKYATGLAALRPDLPANPWARVLRHQLSVDGLPIAA